MTDLSAGGGGASRGRLGADRAMTELREQIWDRVLPRVQARRLEVGVTGDDPGDACREAAEEAIRSLEAEAIHTTGGRLTDADLDWLSAQLEALLGAGPLEAFLRRDDVENIYMFGPGSALLGLVGGRQELVDGPVFSGEDEMIDYIAHLATTHGQTGRRFDQSAPLLDLRLRTGQRLFAAMAVCGTPFLTVRCHRHRVVSLGDLVRGGSVTEEAAGLLGAAVRPPSPSNVLVCGALGAGKTTLLRALLGEIGPDEIVCTLEQTFELFLDESHPYTFAAETREANSDGTGEISMDELARRSLRTGADRMIVGEIRGSEAAVFLSACGTGSDGSMATIHAASTRQALARLIRYCLQAGSGGLPSALVQEAADVVHLVVFMRGDQRTGFRGVHTISEVIGAEGDRFELHDIFGRRRPGGPLELLGRPRNPDVVDRLADGGLDVSDWPEHGRARG